MAGPGGDLTVCPIDGKLLSTASLYRHQIFHSEVVGEHNCKICGKKFKSSYDLKKHVQYGPHSGKSFQCEQCSKSFSRKENLAKHLTSVHQNKKYSCAICGEKFSLSKVKSHYQRCKAKRNGAEKEELNSAVSYTHLTLPTICSV